MCRITICKVADLNEMLLQYMPSFPVLFAGDEVKSLLDQGKIDVYVTHTSIERYATITYPDLKMKKRIRINEGLGIILRFPSEINAIFTHLMPSRPILVHGELYPEVKVEVRKFYFPKPKIVILSNTSLIYILRSTGYHHA